MSCVDVPLFSSYSLKNWSFVRMNFLIIQNNCNFILFVFTFYAVEEVKASS